MGTYVTRIERGEDAFKNAFDNTVSWGYAEYRAQQFAEFFSDLTDCEVAVCRSNSGCIVGRAVVWHDVHAKLLKTNEELTIPTLLDFRTVLCTPSQTNVSMIQAARGGWVVGMGGEVYPYDGEHSLTGFDRDEIELTVPLKLSLERRVIFPWFVKSIFIAICGYKDQLWLSSSHQDRSKIWINDDCTMCQMNFMCPKCGVIMTAGVCFNCGYAVRRYQHLNTPFGPVSSKPHVMTPEWGLVPMDLLEDGKLPEQAQRCILLQRLGEQE